MRIVHAWYSVVRAGLPTRCLRALRTFLLLLGSSVAFHRHFSWTFRCVQLLLTRVRIARPAITRNKCFNHYNSVQFILYIFW